MARTARLLELLITLRTRPRFTVAELTEVFGVSRRTMLRDLHALSEMGVPLAATPGPHGGYRLIADRRALPLTLTSDEAIGIALSYDSFLQYAQSPFAAQSLSAITKLRNALPPDVVAELDRIGRHIAVIERPRSYRAPFLADLLGAAVDGAHLRVVYDSSSGIGERTIYPHGLYAADGFWYCACYDYKRAANLSLRADRFISLERVAMTDHPAPIAVRDWLRTVESFDGHEEEGLRVRARVTARGLKRFELSSFAGEITPDGAGGGTLDSLIPATEIDYFARQFLAVGAEIVVEAPPELVTALREQARLVLAQYTHGAEDWEHQPYGRAEGAAGPART
jgi:predicted DNA-binding transcriptional regulator YafY